jgi:uncharacterized protein (TIGR00730 family)
MRISVFGGSTPKAGEPAYQEALLLGQLLGGAGHTVITGGYIGTMEAVSRGANETGGHVVGITCDEIEAWRPVKPNRWVQQETRYATLRERLFAVTEDCDAAMALPGGPGTLTEISVMWNHMQTAAMPRRPLILIGAGWESVFSGFFRALPDYISPDSRRLLSFATDVRSAMGMLDRYNPGEALS